QQDVIVLLLLGGRGPLLEEPADAERQDEVAPDGRARRRGFGGERGVNRVGVEDGVRGDVRRAAAGHLLADADAVAVDQQAHRHRVVKAFEAIQVIHFDARRLEVRRHALIDERQAAPDAAPRRRRVCAPTFLAVGWYHAFDLIQQADATGTRPDYRNERKQTSMVIILGRLGGRGLPARPLRDGFCSGDAGLARRALRLAGGRDARRGGDEHLGRRRGGALRARRGEAGAGGPLTAALSGPARIRGRVARLHGPESGGLYAVLHLRQGGLDSGARRGLCGLCGQAVAGPSELDPADELCAAGAALLLLQRRQRL